MLDCGPAGDFVDGKTQGRCWFSVHATKGKSVGMCLVVRGGILRIVQLNMDDCNGGMRGAVYVNAEQAMDEVDKDKMKVFMRSVGTTLNADAASEYPPKVVRAGTGFVSALGTRLRPAWNQMQGAMLEVDGSTKQGAHVRRNQPTIRARFGCASFLRADTCNRFKLPAQEVS